MEEAERTKTSEIYEAANKKIATVGQYLKKKKEKGVDRSKEKEKENRGKKREEWNKQMKEKAEELRAAVSSVGLDEDERVQSAINNIAAANASSSPANNLARARRVRDAFVRKLAEADVATKTAVTTAEEKVEQLKSRASGLQSRIDAVNSEISPLKKEWDFFKSLRSDLYNEYKYLKDRHQHLDMQLSHKQKVLEDAPRRFAEKSMSVTRSSRHPRCS